MSANDMDINFSYASWTPNTRFKLCNVTWDMGYRDIVRFENEAKQREYFNSLPGVDFDNCTMSKFGLPVRLRLPFAQACQYNYLIAYNDYDFDTPKYWYYFIQECEYINAYTTQLRIQLDVWQSFQFAVQFGRCYVERGHIGIANEHQMDNYGRDYLDIAEGLDCGGEYQIVATERATVMDKASDPRQNDAVGFVISATTDLTIDGGDEKNPQMATAVPSIADGVLQGVSTYYIKGVMQFYNLISQLAKKPWISQGIVSIFMVPPIDETKNAMKVDMHGVTAIDLWDSTYNRNILNIANFRDWAFQLPQRYRHLKKFLTYPYSYIELTLQNGNSLVIKPQYVSSNDLVIRMQGTCAPPQPRLVFIPLNYNKGQNSQYGEDLNATVGMVDFPRLCVSNNGTLTYLASNAHSIAYGYSSADWANQKTQMGINNAYAQAQIGTRYATRGAELANQNADSMTAIANDSASRALGIQQNAMTQQQNIAQGQNLVNSGINVVGNIASGNAAGAVSALAGGVSNAIFSDMQYNVQMETAAANTANAQQTAIASTSQQNAYRNQATSLNNAQTMQLADMNKELATATAKGDYTNVIAGLNAKIQDANMIQPSVSGQMGGDSMLYRLDNCAIYAKFRRVSEAAIRNIGEFWLRYGYYIQRFMQLPASLMCMTNFTYWKLHEFYLRSSTCPEEYRLTIKGIFEKGVTVWNDPAKIGVTDYADNDPLPGVSY